VAHACTKLLKLLRQVSIVYPLPPQELAALLAIEKEKKLAKRAKAAKDGEDGEEMEDDEEHDEEQAIYNVDSMHDKLEDIAWTEDQPWAETLAITSDEPTEVADVDDDLERELAFYNQALAAAKSAISKFEEAAIPWSRPTDYYAEMVKSDEHMARVKEQLLYEKNVIETAEQRRREREAKKFGKQVAAEKKKERDHEKKKAITSVSALRKQRERSGFAGDLDMDAELARMDSRGGAAGSGRNQKPKTKLGDRFSAHDKSMKRTKRDSKYGFGGKKRLQKQNDAYSAAGGDYTPSRDGGGRGRGRGRGGGRGGRGGFTGGRGGSSSRGKSQRPGKDRRAAMKTRN